MLIADELRNSQHLSTVFDAGLANDTVFVAHYATQMSEMTTIYASRQPRRPHHIPEWAEKRGLKQSDLARELGIDKSVVSRWWAGSSPGKANQESLAQLFDCEVESLFRHPDDDWLARFFANRSREEIEHIKKSMEITFPKSKTG